MRVISTEPKKLLNAKSLASTRPITEIALSRDLSNLLHFSCVFRGHAGIN